MAKINNKNILKRNGDKENVKKKTIQKRKRIKTRQTSSTKFGGLPSQLGDEETCTVRDIIKHFYFLKNIHTHIKDSKIHNMMAECVQTVWKKILPSVPVMSMKTITNKISTLINKVKKINSNQIRKKSESDLTEKLDKLFDISLCKCYLKDKVTCSDR